MNENTGEIRRLTDEEVARLNQHATQNKSGLWHDVSDLPAEEHVRLQGMNRRNRRAFLRAKSKELTNENP